MQQATMPPLACPRFAGAAAAAIKQSNIAADLSLETTLHLTRIKIMAVAISEWTEGLDGGPCEFARREAARIHECAQIIGEAADMAAGEMGRIQVACDLITATLREGQGHA